MNTSLHDLVSRTFAGLEAKNLDLVMGLFADDAVLVDPHFPAPRIQGKRAIADALGGACAGMRSFGYTIVNYFESADGQHAAAEVATHHILKMGLKLNFPQMFVFDATGGRITRIQAYEPYGPQGLAGAFLFLSRLKRRLLGESNPSGT
jgi:ketosteroid isomerase-like protein